MITVVMTVKEKTKIISNSKQYHQHGKVINKPFAKNIIREQPVKFCGYQKIGSNSYRNFSAKVNTISSDNSFFVIKLILPKSFTETL